MANKKFLFFFHTGSQLDRVVIEAETEQDARDGFAVSNPDDRIVKILGPQEA